MPYKSIYQCTCCSGKDFIDPRGVIEFSAEGVKQTVPVSHFGDIEKARIWLVVTNPKGDRKDSNVGHLANTYNVMGRENFTDKHVQKIFRHFSTYFERNGIHPFFNPYMTLLNGLNVDGRSCTFENGGICAVDVIKCPTELDFSSFLIQNPTEGHRICHNCLGRVRNTGPNHFILEQIKNHNPCVLIFAQSTIGLVGVEYKGDGRGNGNLQGFRDMKIFKRNQNPRRISIDLGSNRQFQNIVQNANIINRFRDALQTAINDFF